MSNNKTCTRCGEEKPATLEYFYKHGEALRPECKVCSLKSAKAYREENKEAISEYNKAHYEANIEKSKAYYKENKEAISERKRAWYKANREAILERKKAYYEENKEAVFEYNKAYYRTPKGKHRSIKHDAKERGINFSLPLELYETQLWGKPCHYCGCKIEITGLDRKDSSKGYSRDNVVPCCRRCNSQKQNKPYEQFIQEQKEAEGNNK